MKLYLWADPYQVSYGSSMVFAVAATLAAAKKQAAKGLAYKYGKYKQDWSPKDIAAKLGKPTRVLDLPCAEWHEWSE
ncbi:MAG: hypothetical protein ACK5X3_09470 [Pseudomonadota bacterium]|jgi:hypothetical protein